jgi:D-glycero-beta-D-manno-heptose-7-phosphate kinase
MASTRRCNVSRQPTENHLYDTVQSLAGVRVGVVGDLVADLYVSGLSDRVSREAPVLIVRHEDEWLRPGGAANVAANVAALGATA